MAYEIKRFDIKELISNPILFLIVFIIIFFFGVIILEETFNNAVSMDSSSINTSESILTDNGTTTTLSYSPFSGTTSAITLNRTWLDFNGVNNFLNISDNSYSAVSFWYKNKTTNWQNIINSSGTIYVNGSVGTQLLYPVYFDGSDYLFGKTNTTNFINVSIDEIRFYNGTINSSIALEVYNEGR